MSKSEKWIDNEKWVNQVLDVFNSSSRSIKDKKSMETSLRTAKTIEALYKHLPPEHFPSFMEELDELSKMKASPDPEKIKMKILAIINKYYPKIPLEGLQEGEEVPTYR